jgi:hypothetical protein
VLHIIYGAGRGSEIEDVIYGTTIIWLCDVQLPKLKSRFVLEMRDVSRSACDQIIDAYYTMSFDKQSVTKMRTQKPGAASDQNTHLLRTRVVQEYCLRN